VTATTEQSGPTLRLPAPSLVLLVGPAGVGKSTFARRCFAETTIVSSDRCRARVCDDEDDQGATADAFALVDEIVAARLRRNRLTVVDATNLEPDARRPLLALAARHHVLAVAVVFGVDRDTLLAQNAARVATGTRRPIPPDILDDHLRLLEEARQALPREGLARIVTLSTPDEARRATVHLDPLPCDRRSESGPFDLIGDIHGCFGALVRLLEALEYRVEAGAEGSWRVTPPPGRRVIFLGDLVDRGPAVTEVLALVSAMVADGHALALAGNHEAELLRVLGGGTPRPGYGTETSVAQLARVPAARIAQITAFLGSLPDHLVLDGGRLVAAHARLPPTLHGRAGHFVRETALLGEGLPATPAADPAWLATYGGEPAICYGHTPVDASVWVNGTLNLDTGCVFGGALTALRYPERTLVSVPAVD